MDTAKVPGYEFNNEKQNATGTRTILSTKLTSTSHEQARATHWLHLTLHILKGPVVIRITSNGLLSARKSFFNLGCLSRGNEWRHDDDAGNEYTFFMA